MHHTSRSGASRRHKFNKDSQTVLTPPAARHALRAFLAGGAATFLAGGSEGLGAFLAGAEGLEAFLAAPLEPLLSSFVTFEPFSSSFLTLEPFESSFVAFAPFEGGGEGLLGGGEGGAAGWEGLGFRV